MFAISEGADPEEAALPTTKDRRFDSFFRWVVDLQLAVAPLQQCSSVLLHVDDAELMRIAAAVVDAVRLHPRRAAAVMALLQQPQIDPRSLRALHAQRSAQPPQAKVPCLVAIVP
ncbi:uncharacterized protein A4U43_C02F22220 [Asparagus officinalis]|uniref:Uncharacterized protein n=1 Tax=Asparagus officinalis TaxID=4686 RepID=A0A5P1FP77_ASPOF|nr:uncharacterized protein A4U43_C02F22220 [Asparagus officinalis]